jgi:hypothetical protein
MLSSQIIVFDFKFPVVLDNKRVTTNGMKTARATVLALALHSWDKITCPGGVSFLLHTTHF